MRLLQSWWQAWLNRRLPASRQIQLSHKSVFIVPSKAGLLFLLLLSVMLVTAINYQNNLIYILVFWLFSLALVAMLLTFRNLAGLVIRAGRVSPCFVGDNLTLPIHLYGKQRNHQAIYLAFSQAEGVQAQVLAQAEQQVSLRIKASERGYLKTERIKVESRFPLGLFRAWSWVQLEFSAVVYPKPIAAPITLSENQNGSSEKQLLHPSSGQDFYGLRAYRAGDAMNRIAWKQVAQGKGLVTKEFSQAAGANHEFNFDSLVGLPTEQRLSHLCAWLLEAQQQEWSFALVLPTQTLALNRGDEHVRQCLTALALYGK
ncbi:MAG: DUF58 domain-containing protein [Venatoribacter sp.]